MIVKRFKNGNFNVKMEKEDFNSRDGTLIEVIWTLGNKDCYLFGEEYCLSNWEMAVDMYDCYMDRLVRIPYSVLDDLENGKTIKLYSREMTEEDRGTQEYLIDIGEI